MKNLNKPKYIYKIYKNNFKNYVMFIGVNKKIKNN